jgi:hypothetical protein
MTVSFICFENESEFIFVIEVQTPDFLRSSDLICLTNPSRQSFDFSFANQI